MNLEDCLGLIISRNDIACVIVSGLRYLIWKFYPVYKPHWFFPCINILIAGITYSALILTPKADSKHSTTVQGENCTSEFPNLISFKEKSHFGTNFSLVIN